MGIASEILWAESALPGHDCMIYVTTGTHPVPFDRLIAAMETYASSTPEEVVIQAGASHLPLKHAKRLTFIGWEESLNYIKSARIVVCHAGVGTLMDAIAANSPIVVWPRLAQFGEHVNDHQLEIAEKLSQQGRVILVHNADELFEALQSANFPLPRGANAGSGALIQEIRERLNAMRPATHRA